VGGSLLVTANPRHDIGGRALLPKFVGHEIHAGTDVGEELLVAAQGGGAAAGDRL
jgi:hypothetical protein